MHTRRHGLGPHTHHRLAFDLFDLDFDDDARGSTATLNCTA
jgi:hypothetical protein